MKIVFYNTEQPESTLIDARLGKALEALSTTQSRTQGGAFKIVGSPRELSAAREL